MEGPWGAERERGNSRELKKSNEGARGSALQRKRTKGRYVGGPSGKRPATVSVTGAVTRLDSLWREGEGLMDGWPDYKDRLT